MRAALRREHEAEDYLHLRCVDPAILEDRCVHPDAATMQHLYTITAHDQKTQRLINRLWTRIKTGI